MLVGRSKCTDYLEAVNSLLPCSAEAMYEGDEGGVRRTGDVVFKKKDGYPDSYRENPCFCSGGVSASGHFKVHTDFTQSPILETLLRPRKYYCKHPEGDVLVRSIPKFYLLLHNLIPVNYAQQY